VPVDDIAGIIAGRLLGRGVRILSGHPPATESNRGEMESFLASSGVHPILDRRGRDIAEPDPANGARAVTAALRDRADAMRASLADLKVQLARDVENLVSNFDPRKAVRELLGSTDVFRIQRVAFGHHGLKNEIEKDGARGLLRRRLTEQQPPEGYDLLPPPIPRLSDRLLGLQKVHWDDPEPSDHRDRQNAWYRWRTLLTWTEPWAAHEPTWRRPLDQVERELEAFTRELTEYARRDDEQFARRSGDLYRPRVGVSYLLPPGGNDMEHYYDQVKRHLIDHLSSGGQLRVNAAESDLLPVLIGPDGWRTAYDISLDHGPRQAVTFLHDRIKTEVKSFLRLREGGRVPMLPRLHNLLSAAALSGGRDSEFEDYVEEFRGKLAGLVPANFTPQGSGPMKVLVSYPADDKNPVIAEYLRSHINLPEGHDIVYSGRPTQAESLSVVLFRTSMGVTEVREVRRVLRQWTDALTKPAPADKLRWRQRTGYDFGYLATREEHRIEILHRFLCAMWNGRMHTVPEDNQASPERIRVVLDGGVTMNLQLNPFDQASSWGSLIRSYEPWTFDDSEVHRRFSAQLMKELPNGLAHKAAEPSDLFISVCKLAEEQKKLLDEMVKNLPAESRTRALQMYSFWAVTLPAALNEPFEGIDSPMRPTLAQLQDAVTG
jgi:hypothetical protein